MIREAINELKKYTLGKKNTEKVEISVLQLNRVIKALEQEPCEDAINRQAVIDAIDKWVKNMGVLIALPVNEVVPLFESIHKLQTVNPQDSKTGWIPVSERLPEESGFYWCTFGGTNLMESDYYRTESDAKELFGDPEEYAGWRSQNVTAWMPLPKPYEPQESEG